MEFFKKMDIPENEAGETVSTENMETEKTRCLIIGSGPARAQAVVDSDYYFEMTDYRDQNEECVLCLQMQEMPGEKIADEIHKIINAPYETAED